MNVTSQSVAPDEGPARANPRVGAGRRARAAWCLFDFANSPFPTLALTAFGAPYFDAVLVGDGGVHLLGVTLGPKVAWGVSLALSMLLVTVTSPFLGALADRTGSKRIFLVVYVLLCVAATASLSLVSPGQGLLAMALYVVANFAFEGAYVFYNAFLPELAPPERIGRLSGLGWAFGYLGGLLALVLVKFALPLLPERYEAAGTSGAHQIYAVVAAWYLVFALPALLWLPSGQRRPRTTKHAPPQLRGKLRALVSTLRAYPVVATFLLAYFLYNDGVTTVIEFVAIFTKDVLAFSPGDNVLLFLILNVVAAPGAYAFGSLLDRLGGKRTINITLIGWLFVVIGSVLTTSKAGFWPVATLAAVVIGATQASSRSLMAKLAPPDRIGEFMGFLALSGKASAVVGPLMYGLVADGFADTVGPANASRLAVLCVGGLFLAALLVMRKVDESAGLAQATKGGENG